VADEEIGEGGEAEGGGESVERVGGGGTEPGHETGEAAVVEGAADAEQADGADGGGDGEADDGAFEERVHGEREDSERRNVELRKSGTEFWLTTDGHG
jgi:hypothetical protein